MTANDLALNPTMSEPTYNAVLDTNVRLDIYSWHDIMVAVDASVAQDSAANLRRPAVQYRAQRARASFFLTLFFDERGWTTLGPINELERTLVKNADPSSLEQAARSNFVKLYLHFVKSELITQWRDGGDRSDDLAIKGDDVDLLCVELAAKHQIPLISWEGVSQTGVFDDSKLIPQEARRRGVDLVTPFDFIRREQFDPRSACERFFRNWDEKASTFAAAHKAEEVVEYAHHWYMRLAKNDWDP